MSFDEFKDAVAAFAEGNGFDCSPIRNSKTAFALTGKDDRQMYFWLEGGTAVASLRDFGAWANFRSSDPQDFRAYLDSLSKSI